MREIELGEIAEVFGGYAFKSKDFNETLGIPVIKISNIQDGEVSEETLKQYLPESYLDDYKNYQIRKGDILVALSGATTGKTGVYKLEKKSLLNQRVGLVRAKNGQADQKYLSYYVSKITDDILNKAQGVAQPNISTKELAKFKIPLPSLSEQKAIVTKLDRAQRLVDIDKEMLAKYDELIQSVFLEMFGDVFSDQTKTPFEDHLDIKHGYTFKSKWFDDEGDVPVVKIGTVNKSEVDFSDIQFLDNSYAEEYERFKIHPGDLLLSMTGTVGKDDYANPCIMTDDYDFYLLNQRVVRLNYDEKIFTKSFLYHFFKQDYIKRELTKFSRGIRQANLSNKDIYGLSFQKPDFEKQLQFEALWEKVKKEKKSLKETLKKSEVLFSSLVQGAFG